MNDMQKHLLKKVGEASDEYRASRRALATEVVDSILSALKLGLTREQIIDDLSKGLTAGRV